VERFAQDAASRLRPKLGLEEAEIASLLLRIVAGGPTEKPYTGTSIQRAGLKAFSADLIADYVTNVSLASKLDEGKPMLVVPERLRKEVEVLKHLTWFYVIDNRAIKTQQHGQRRVVRDLFRIYYRATGSDDKDLQGILPDVHLDLLGEPSDRVTRARVVADLISSMTERQLLITHRKLTGTELGSITDLM
jgi:dGTPase